MQLRDWYFIPTQKNITRCYTSHPRCWDFEKPSIGNYRDPSNSCTFSWRKLMKITHTFAALFDWSTQMRNFHDPWRSTVTHVFGKCNQQGFPYERAESSKESISLGTIICSGAQGLCLLFGGEVCIYMHMDGPEKNQKHVFSLSNHDMISPIASICPGLNSLYWGWSSHFRESL